MVEMSGDRTPTPLLRTSFAEFNARISPDGRWLAYVSNESRLFAVYVTSFPQPAAKWRVSTPHGTFPVWSRDGRELYYVDLDGRLMAVPIRGDANFEAGTPVPLFVTNGFTGGAGGGTFYDVAADGRFLVNVFVERTSPPAFVVLNWPASLR
jgi:Tol biopolymer transport system component